MLHTSSEGKVLEDPWEEVPDYVFSRTDHLEAAPDQAEIITVDFEKGDAVAINGEAMSPATLLVALNGYGKRHDNGRIDPVATRYVCMQPCGMFEPAGGPVMLAPHRGLDQ